MEENEKLGKILIDGKVIDLDSAPVSELEELENKLEAEIEKQKKIIEDNLFSDIDENVEEY